MKPTARREGRYGHLDDAGWASLQRDVDKLFAYTGDCSSVYANIVHTHDDRYFTETESDARYVNVAGDSMTGNLYLGAHGLGNNASVLTFAATGTGLATFGGGATFGAGVTIPYGSAFAWSGAASITNESGVMAFAGATGYQFGGSVSLLADNLKAIFGTGSDATIYYNGTNMILDPNEVGTGKVYVGATANDNIAAAGYYFGTGVAGYIGWFAAVAGIGFFHTTYHATGPPVYIWPSGLLVARGGIECASSTNISTLNFGRQSEGAGTGAYIQETRTTEEFKIGVNVNCGIQLILTHTSNILQDHDHATPTNPTLYLHSATAPDVNNTQWMSLTHDQTNGVLAVGTGSIVLSNNTIIGVGAAATDYTLTFDGETNDGVLTWMEDEDYFQLSDDLLMTTTERVYFRDTAISVYSANDGYLDLVADTAFRFNTGNVFVLAIKSGATQVAAGAAAGELWKTSGHASLPDNVVMLGV